MYTRVGAAHYIRKKSSVNSYNLAMAAANLLADISGCSLL